MGPILHFLNVFVNSFPLFLHGLLVTMELTIVSLVAAFVLGLIIALFKISNIKALEWISDAYVWVVRGTPLLVQIVIIYNGLPAAGIVLPAFWAGAAGLTFHSGAYIAEVIRGSIQSIDKGQMEAGRTLGMSRSLTMRRIVLPQAFRRAIPPFGNQFIIGLKDSSLVSFVGAQELFGTSNSLGSNNFDFLTFYSVVAVYYLFVVLILTLVVNRLEKRLAARE